MSLLVVIPTIKEVPTKDQLFNDLQNDLFVSEVLVIDNGDCFNLSNYPHLSKFQEIDAGCNLNWLAACNVGIGLAVTRGFTHVCLLNDDSILSRSFFQQMTTSAYRCKDLGALLPLYTGISCIAAHDDRSVEEWVPETKEEIINGIDGTCLFLPVSVIKSVGFLDPVFFGPGWGSELDFKLRLHKAGLHVYLTRRCKLWHSNATSASQIYGSEKEYCRQASLWAIEGFKLKYGNNWREDLKIPKAFKIN